MKELKIEEIRKIELEILCKFHDFCIENDISYFLSNGTLLGAVKYKGFIPWDDDIDVLVPRKDYDRFIAVFQDDDRYHLFAYERNSKYRYPFAKLCDLSTIKKEVYLDNEVSLGIDIDIFPLDSWEDDLMKAKAFMNKIQRNMFYLYLSKLIRADSKNLVKRVIKGCVMRVMRIIGSEYFVQRIINLSRTKGENRSLYLGCKSWCVYGEREIIPAKVFSDSIELEFEGKRFYAPVGYDAYLRSLYGEYEKDPPAEKQKTHHSFKAYKL